MLHIIATTTTADKIYNIVKKLPAKKQKQILDYVVHDCEKSHVPNKETIKAIKETKKNIETAKRFSSKKEALDFLKSI